MHTSMNLYTGQCEATKQGKIQIRNKSKHGKTQAAINVPAKFWHASQKIPGGGGHTSKLLLQAFLHKQQFQIYFFTRGYTQCHEYTTFMSHCLLLLRTYLHN